MRGWLLAFVAVPAAFAAGAWVVFTVRFLVGILPHGGVW